MSRIFEHIEGNRFKLLNESIDPIPKEWGNISKIEEQQGLDEIRKKWIPKAVEMWNKTHRTYKVSTEEVLKNLKKVRHDSKQGDDVIKFNRSDIIHYQYKVPNTRNTMTFMIHRIIKGKTNSLTFPLMAGFFSGTALFEEPVVI